MPVLAEIAFAAGSLIAAAVGAFWLRSLSVKFDSAHHIGSDSDQIRR
jgi:hypothetical protein